MTTTQRYPHPDVRQITAAGAALTARLSVLRAPGPFRARSPSPADTVKTGLVPKWSPKTIEGPFQIALKRPLDSRLFRVGTTGFEPATP
ncbi:phage integrase [Streptomyces laurentii]|uniref:Phage integrase n=1 Tax=Streptomyces laurentii TaxID=39478 RepID=A0A169PDG7_STRLU|nr:phage integrase [Streptomyces laurentii]